MELLPENYDDDEAQDFYQDGNHYRAHFHAPKKRLKKEKKRKERSTAKQTHNQRKCWSPIYYHFMKTIRGKENVGAEKDLGVILKLQNLIVDHQIFQSQRVLLRKRGQHQNFCREQKRVSHQYPVRPS